jgi:hypothetical protein
MERDDNCDVFKSCAHRGGAAARELNEHGLNTLFDRRAFRPGLRWVPALEEAIGRSKAAAILVFEHGIGNNRGRLRAEKIAVQPTP